MWPSRILACALLALAPGVRPLSLHTAGPVASHVARSRGGVNGGYPRLANYNGFMAAGQAPFVVGYNLIIARRAAPVVLLRAANPRVVTLLYERTLQADLCCMGALYGLEARRVPAQWWLLGAGSRLTQSIGKNQDWITVADPRPFAPCDDVLVGGESMHVWAVQGHRLHVLRGYYSARVRHRAGARIAPHISYRTDLSNCRLRGPGADPRPWSLNVSSRCPRWHGETWDEYLARYVAALVRRDGWSGVFFDNLNDLPFSPLADTNDDGRADGGIVGGVNVWEAGARALLAGERRLLPHRPLLVNGDLRIVGLANGREMEAFPTIPGLPLAAAIDAYLAGAALGTPRTIVNPDTQGRYVPSSATADLAVGVSLLGDGYAAYDRGWQDHGAPWWFDSYAQVPGARLRLPVGPWTAQLVVPHPWQYRVGQTVLLSQEAAVVTGVTPHAVLVERGMDGTVAAPHDAGTLVSTAWQRLRGHGYLGLPRSSLLPLSVASVAGLQSVGLGSLGTHNSLALRSRPHYDPNAVAITLTVPSAGPVLRTLTFDARGPAGAEVWITAGSSSVPIVLRGGWHHYVLPLAGVTGIIIGVGRVAGRVLLRDLRLYGTQAFVWRRDFTHGIVLVNPTDRLQRVSLHRPYRVATGDGPSSTAAGTVTCSVTLAHYRAAILLDGPPGARCPSTRSKATGARGARATSAAPVAYVVTTADALHLRAGPSWNAAIITTLPRGTRLAVGGDVGDWVAVTTPDGTRGYVLRTYVAPMRR